MNQIQELTRDWPAFLQLKIAAYIDDHGLYADQLMRVDLVLILLRLADAAAPGSGVREDYLERIAELTGKAITKCPTAMPPWPPKPVDRPPKGTTLAKAASPYPCSKSSDMARRYSLLKVGMTVEQIMAKGVTARDLRHWKNKGFIELTGE